MISFNVKTKMKPKETIIRKRHLEEKGKVQMFVDSEVIRRSTPLVPFDTGMLSRSATIHTRLGSGEVTWNTPYARRQYYEHKGSGNRGPRWFERMKANHKKDILQGAAKIAGGRIK